MKYLLFFAVLCIIGAYCSSCKKGTETIVKTDTLIVRDTVRDTLNSKLIRIDHYKGYGEVDCMGTCPLEIDSSATTDLGYYSNDSTDIIVKIGKPGAPKHQFYFSIVKGRFLGRDANVDYYEHKGPDSLKYYGYEQPHGMSTLTYLFRGKLQ